MNLYVCTVQSGHKAFIVDIDPQGSAFSSAMRRSRAICEDLATIAAACEPANLSALIARLAAEGVEFILIGTPGVVGPTVDPTLAVCNYALVTSGPTIEDLEAVLPTAHALHSFGKDLPTSSRHAPWASDGSVKRKHSWIA